MKQVSPNQLSDAYGAFSDAARSFGGLVQAEVPRPSFPLFEQWAIQESVVKGPNGYMVRPRVNMPGFAGLMAIVLVPRRNQEPGRVAGIVLEDERRVGILGGHEALTPLAQSLLTSVYLNNRQSVLEHPGGQVRAGFGGHAVVAASALATRGNVHTAVHSFTPATFGTELTRQGLQDIHVGHAVIPVRAGTLALQQVGLEIAAHHQPHAHDMLGSGLTGEAANVALTVAATISNPESGKPDLARSLGEMAR